MSADRGGVGVPPARSKQEPGPRPVTDVVDMSDGRLSLSVDEEPVERQRSE